jgi:hypothetical protein
MGRLVPGIPPSAGRLEREGQALDGAWKRETGRRRGRRSARRKGESAVERPVRDPEEKRKFGKKREHFSIALWGSYFIFAYPSVTFIKQLRR